MASAVWDQELVWAVLGLRQEPVGDSLGQR